MKEVLEVLECELKAIKERLAQDLFNHLEYSIDWVLDNSYRHAALSEVSCWIDYVSSTEEEKLPGRTQELIHRISNEVMEEDCFIECIVSHWIMSEIMTFDMETLEDIMEELLDDFKTEGGE